MEPPRLVISSVNVVLIYWNPPLIPNGIITLYKVYRFVSGTPFTLAFSGLPTGTLTARDDTVAPSSTYVYMVEVLNSAGGLNSSAVAIEIPENTVTNIGAPTLLVAQSPYSIFVEWTAPPIVNTCSNCIDQYRVVLNAGSNVSITKGAGMELNLIVDSLLPYTVYEVRISACLSGIMRGCGLGPGKSVTTHQAKPTGMQPAILTAQGPSVVEVEWKEPVNANGVITSYRVHRRQAGDTGPGVLINVVSGGTRVYTNAGPELEPFTEYEYKITAVNSKGTAESPWEAVHTLQSPPRLLGPPIISTIQAYSLTLSWSVPGAPNGVIQYYKIEYREEPNIQDSSREYPIYMVTVGPAVRTTTVSGLTPYTRHQMRIIAVNEAGEVSSTWVTITTGQAAPADIEPFTVETISTGLSVILRWAEPQVPNGIIINYLIFESDNINPIYQGLGREFEYRRLQPYTTYSVLLQACTTGGCGKSPKQTFITAEVPPTNLEVPTPGFINATMVIIRWKKPVNPSGKITLYQVFRKMSSRIRLRKKRDAHDGIVIYSTDQTDSEDYEYTDSGLKSYMKYEYKVRSINSAGQTDSPWMIVETEEAPPQGMLPPVVSHVGTASDRLYVTWKQPSQPNGIIQMYQLRRNDSVLWVFEPEDAKSFTDTSLAAYTYYSYSVYACTGGGCSTSTATVVRTPESTPYFVNPPSLTTVGSTSIRVTWVEPQITNGKINKYKLVMDGEILFEGSNREYTVENLTPYQLYVFVLTACTLGGCNNSAAVSGRPGEAAPLGMQAPKLHVTSSTSIEVTWDAPLYPNGIITMYDVRRDGVLVDSTTNLMYFDFEVLAGREYTYRVTAFNSRGSTVSPAATATTYASSPSGLAPPTLQAESSTSVRASWTAPIQPNGDIFNYTLYKDNEIVYSDKHFDTLVDGLDHWTQYSFRIQACTAMGCTLSDASLVRTLEAPPKGLQPPRLTAYADVNGAHNGVLVEWIPPSKPNGIIIRYEIYRRNATGLPPGKSLINVSLH